MIRLAETQRGTLFLKIILFLLELISNLTSSSLIHDLISSILHCLNSVPDLIVVDMIWVIRNFSITEFLSKEEPKTLVI